MERKFHSVTHEWGSLSVVFITYFTVNQKQITFSTYPHCPNQFRDETMETKHWFLSKIVFWMFQELFAIYFLLGTCVAPWESQSSLRKLATQLKFTLINRFTNTKQNSWQSSQVYKQTLEEKKSGINKSMKIKLIYCRQDSWNLTAAFRGRRYQKHLTAIDRACF